MRRFAALLILATAITSGGARAAVSNARVAHTITYDRYSLKLDGKRVYVWSGEFHYWRLPSRRLWRDVLEKMKAGGYNAVSIYFDWAFHSPAPGVYDFNGIRDVDALLNIAQEVGIYVIARPGPYINAEVDSGGFPAWLVTRRGHARSSDSGYLAPALEWMSQIDRILARHQFTTSGGPVILYQVENEYIETKDEHVDRAYMAALERQARSDGITVPLTHNSCCGDGARWAHGVGAVDIDAYDNYAAGLDCAKRTDWAEYDGFSNLRKRDGDVPFYLAEFQGGAIDYWGGPGYRACARMTDARFERVYDEQNIAAGASLQNFYMTFGGTNWGWIASPEATYTSYDYGAPIDETRALTAKYDEQKLLGYAVHTLPLTHLLAQRSPGVQDPAVRIDARVDAESRAQIFIVRHATLRWPGNDRIAFALTGRDGSYARVPQEPGTAIALHGEDSKLLVAGLTLGETRLVYSTSELVTDVTDNRKHILLLRGRAGEDGETVLRYRARPAVEVQSGIVHVHWDSRRGDLRLNYAHRGLARVLITARRSGRQLLLLLGDDATAARFWSIGNVLVSGPYLVRTAHIRRDTLTITCDTVSRTHLEVFSTPDVKHFRWNGAEIAMQRSRFGTHEATLPGPAPVVLPMLTSWRMQNEAPEREPSFDDSKWSFANGSLLLDAYGCHYGDAWLRGHFTATGQERAIALDAYTGNAGAYTVWLNGHALASRSVGETEHDRLSLTIAPDLLVKGDNVISLLLANTGHDQDFSHDDKFRKPRGLTQARLDTGVPIAWRVNGACAQSVAPQRYGWMNAGGLYGEREGWYLPQFDDAAWTSTALQASTGPGVTWYRNVFSLRAPPGQDVVVGIKIADRSAARYRALFYVNGWQFGQYVNTVGPQHVFPIPPGIMNLDGRNTIAMAIWSLDADAGPSRVELILMGNRLSAP